MKVDSNLEEKLTVFVDIKRGYCFLYSGELYIRLSKELEVPISGKMCDDDKLRYFSKYNAVRLSDGCPICFDSITIVKSCDAKVVNDSQ